MKSFSAMRKRDREKGKGRERDRKTTSKRIKFKKKKEEGFSLLFLLQRTKYFECKITVIPTIPIHIYIQDANIK